jgi:hypothetical protein
MNCICITIVYWFSPICYLSVSFYINVSNRYDNRRPFLRQSTILLPWDTRPVLPVAVEIRYEKQFLTKLNLLQEYTL